MSGMSMPTAGPAGRHRDRARRARPDHEQPAGHPRGAARRRRRAARRRRAPTAARSFRRARRAAQVHAVAVVDGERLESQPFEVPAQGGVRTILVATDGDGCARSAGQTRRAGRHRSAAAVGQRVVALDRRQLPDRDGVLRRRAAGVLPARDREPHERGGHAGVGPRLRHADRRRGHDRARGLDENANAKGTRVTVTGPFAPGVTPLQIAFRLDSLGSAATITLDGSRCRWTRCRWPCRSRRDDRQLAAGRAYCRRRRSTRRCSSWAWARDCRPARRSSCSSTGLPHKSRAPVYVALGARVGHRVRGRLVHRVPGSVRGRGRAPARPAGAAREGLAALAALERSTGPGASTRQHYTARRAALVAQLERVYGELDSRAARRRAGRASPRERGLRPADPDRRLPQLRPPARALARVVLLRDAARSSACSARTARASRRCSRFSPRCCVRAPATCATAHRTAQDGGAAVRARLGLLGHELQLYPELTAAENLRFFARLYGLSRRRCAACVDALAPAALADRARRSRCQASRAACGSGSRSSARCSTSRGCCCSTSRSPASTRRRRPRSSAACARSRAGGRIIVLATHDLDLAEGLLTRVGDPPRRPRGGALRRRARPCATRYEAAVRPRSVAS